MKSVATVASVLAVLVPLMSVGQQSQQGQNGQNRGGGPVEQDPRSMGGGNCADNPWNCKDAANPLPAYDSIWIEQMTWMDVRDAMKAGKQTVLIPTGGIEPSGPFLSLGKHNVVLKANCEAIARKLGMALCAPIVPFVPEGNIDPPTSHMRSPGTISLREDTFDALLIDIVESMKVHGFKNIMLIGDSAGNLPGMSRVAERLNKQWPDTTVAHIREYDDYASVTRLLAELGLPSTRRDGLHDDPNFTLNMMATDPDSVRWSQRVKAGLATINGVSIADRDKSLQAARRVVEMRATNAVAAIRKAIETKGASTIPAPPAGRRPQ